MAKWAISEQAIGNMTLKTMEKQLELERRTAFCLDSQLCWRLIGLGLALTCHSQPGFADDYLLGSMVMGNDPTRLQRPIVGPKMLEKAKPSDRFELPPLSEQDQPAPAGETVVIKQLLLEGNTVFSQQELQAIVAGYLNREIRVSDIEAIRNRISKHYEAHGYINSGAVLSSQSLASGVLTLKIIEGRLSEVRQSGQGRLREGYLRDRLIIGGGEPLNVNDLQESYRLLLGNPMIEKLNGQLLPGKRLGETIFDVNVTRARPYQLSFSADNYQTPSVGEYTGRVGGWVDNLLTLGERIDAQFIASGGALGYNTGIELPLNAWDTRFSFRYSDVESSIIEREADQLDAINHVVGFDGGLSHPVYRTFADDLTLGLNFAVRQNHTMISGRDLPIEAGGSQTQVTVLRMSQHYSHRGDSNSLVFLSTFNAGLDALGATVNSEDFPGGQFFSWLGQSMFLQRLLDNGTNLVVRANIQLADSPMLSLERYAIGGVYTVRGYRENTYVRDNGFNTSVEVQYPIYELDTEQRNSLHLVPFWDYGGGWNNPGNPGVDLKTDYLFSAGIGLNWQFRQVSADFYWAHAFTPVRNKTIAERSTQDDGIHFRINIDAF